MAMPVLQLDPQQLRTCFDRRPFAARHRLAADPGTDAPLVLAEAMRDAACSAGDEAGGDAPPRELSEACLDELRRALAPLDAEVHGCTVRLTRMPAGAISEYRFEPEHQLLLQLHGHCTAHVFDPRDRRVLSEEELERCYTSGVRRLAYRVAVERHAEVFSLRAGDLLHVPVTAPHWLQNGETPSLALRIGFRTASLRRRDAVYALNSRLRRLGIAPTPYGYAPLRDRLKAAAERALRRVLKPG
ncbi:MAG: hypothetical protein ACK4N5_12335 [Myxococcales bacterium]